jgi:hypothetical protein
MIMGAPQTFALMGGVSSLLRSPLLPLSDLQKQFEKELYDIDQRYQPILQDIIKKEAEQKEQKKMLPRRSIVLFQIILLGTITALTYVNFPVEHIPQKLAGALSVMFGIIATVQVFRLLVR